MAEAQSVEDIIAVVRNPERYPAPVRAIGSNHSTTRCGVADGGTMILMHGMNRVLEVGEDFVTAEAGALYIDVAKTLERHGRQFHVNVELGNLTVGSAACGGTKDASMPGEFGQVSSYVIGVKMVTPAGEMLEITQEDPERLRMVRASYGLFGIIYEVTFKIAPLRAMAVHHQSFGLDEFERRLPELIGRGESMMLYIMPFLGSVTVEFRRYHDAPTPAASHWQWRLRNWAWSKATPLFAYLLTKYVPAKRIRYFVIDGLNRIVTLVLRWLVRGRNTVPTDQIIRYPSQAGKSKYTFSIWAFPEHEYPRILHEYSGFCRAYYARTGYRPNLTHVGYRIAHDEGSHFSYSSEGTVLTIDPVSTADPGWEVFLHAYNEFCSEHGGVPLFNQTRGITRDQARRAFGNRLTAFEAERARFDPDNRLLNEYFADILSTEQAHAQRRERAPGDAAVPG